MGLAEVPDPATLEVAIIDYSPEFYVIACADGDADLDGKAP